MNDNEPRCMDLAQLHPLVQAQFNRLRDDLDQLYVRSISTVRFEIFETWRSPTRQFQLFQLGATRALPWKSAHQYGLAVDFVPRIGGKWSWDDERIDWSQLRAAALRVGLDAPISWDRAHVESPLFNRLRQAIDA